MNSARDIFSFEINFVGYTRISHLFPNKDFCLYKDFPFNQFVILTKVFMCCTDIPDEYKMEFTCTFMWISQYYSVLVNLTKHKHWNEYLEYVLKSNASRPYCNFDLMVKLCEKTYFKTTYLWSNTNTYKLVNRVDLVVLILKYIFSAFGIVTNCCYLGDMLKRMLRILKI